MKQKCENCNKDFDPADRASPTANDGAIKKKIIRRNLRNQGYKK